MFKVSKSKEKIKFDKIRRYQNQGLPQVMLPKFNFLTAHARHMKFSG